MRIRNSNGSKNEMKFVELISNKELRIANGR